MAALQGNLQVYSVRVYFSVLDVNDVGTQSAFHFLILRVYHIGLCFVTDLFSTSPQVHPGETPGECHNATVAHI